MQVQLKNNLDMHNNARICVYSQRLLQQMLSACGDYEFEDLICQFDVADILIAEPSQGFKTKRQISSQLARRTSISNINPGVKKLKVDRDYDLFFAKFLLKRDLLSLNALKNWKERCKVAICWLAEAWEDDVKKWKGYAKILSQFDYVILNCSASVQPLQDLINRPCMYIPPGVDAIKFCPYPDPPERSVDIYSIGRKSKVTHKALLNMAEQKKIFYIYDTLLGMYTAWPQEHRSLVVNIAKRSRYFLVNPAKIDRRFETGGQDELGFRYFEGVASGAVMIGEHPKTKVFEEQFGWTDSVIRVPFDTPNIAEILADLDSQPQRLAKARKRNIVQALLRHDWTYRWREILKVAGLQPNTALTNRLDHLKKLAEGIEKNSELLIDV